MGNCIIVLQQSVVIKDMSVACKFKAHVQLGNCLITVPEIEVVDDRDKKTAEKYYKGGSTIELKCIVRQIVGEPPEYILWHHEDKMLNYDTERGGIRYTCACTIF